MFAAFGNAGVVMEECGFVCFVKAWGRGSVLIFPASDPVVGGDNAEVVLGFVFSGVLRSSKYTVWGLTTVGLWVNLGGSS